MICKRDLNFWCSNALRAICIENIGNYNEVFAGKVSLFTKSQKKGGKTNISGMLWVFTLKIYLKKRNARYALVGICDLTMHFICMKIGHYI